MPIGWRNRKFFVLFVMWSATLAGFALALSAYELPKLAEPPHAYRLPMDGPEWHALREVRARAPRPARA